MRDFQFWLYVIIGVIYLISRFMKKRKEVEAGAESEGGSNTDRPVGSPGEKQLTFEELLREITQAKTEVQQKPQPVVAKPKTVNYEESMAEEEQDLEEVDYDYKKEDTIYATYEKAKKEAFFRPSLEEVDWKTQKTEAFEKFKGFEIEKKPDLMARYLGNIKNPDELKKAFVVSEILKPKF
jgi:preprotein translocase subunit SecF